MCHDRNRGASIAQIPTKVPPRGDYFPRLGGSSYTKVPGRRADGAHGQVPVVRPEVVRRPAAEHTRPGPVVREPRSKYVTGSILCPLVGFCPNATHYVLALALAGCYCTGCIRTQRVFTRTQFVTSPRRLHSIHGSSPAAVSTYALHIVITQSSIITVHLENMKETKVNNELSTKSQNICVNVTPKSMLFWSS